MINLIEERWVMKEIIRKEIKNYIHKGKFDLSNGQTSETYVDIKTFLTKPTFMQEITKLFMSEYPYMWYSHNLIGIELGGVPIVVSLGRAMNISYGILRKAPKSNGLYRRYIGHIYANKYCIIFDDVATSGTSLLDAYQYLYDDLGMTCNQAFVVVDREEGAKQLLKKEDIELKSLFTLREILE